MKNSQKKDPPSLFWSGVALSILRSFLWLVISTVLLLIGRTTPWCGAAGLALLVIVVGVAIVKQLIYRHTALHSVEDDWQSITLSPEWRDNVIAMVERAMNDDIQIPNEEEDGEDSEDQEDSGDGE